MIEIAIATELQVHVLEESVLPGGGEVSKYIIYKSYLVNYH